MFYSKGWVQDLDKATKRQKQLTKQYQFLGSETIKMAYFGLPSSGALNLFVPLPKARHPQLEMEQHATGLLPARGFVESVVLCETDLLKYHAAEATSDLDHVCRLKRDAYVYVGGEMALLETFPSDVSSSCAFFRVPEGATLSSRRDAFEKIPANDSQDSLHKQDKYDAFRLGLPVEIRVRTDKGNFKEPCSLAHVMWREATDRR